MDVKFSRILKPWLGQLAISWIIAVIILLPVAKFQADRIAEAKLPFVEYTFEPRAAELAQKLPPNDDALLTWALPLAHGNVSIRRVTRGENTELIIKFQTEHEIADVPWAELGYDVNSAVRSGSRSTPLILEPNFGIWVQRASLVATAGYLFFGVRAWRRRSIPERFYSTSRTLLWGLGGGLVFSGLGLVASMFPALGGVFPQVAPWFFDFTISGLPVMILSIFCIIGILLVPLAHELFFRQGLFASAAAGGNARSAAIIASIVPALSLIQAPLMAFLVVCTGLANCWLLRRTGRLLAPVVCSTMATAAGFLLLWLMIRDAPSLSQSISDLLNQGQEQLFDQLSK